MFALRARINKITDYFRGEVTKQTNTYFCPPPRKILYPRLQGTGFLRTISGAAQPYPMAPRPDSVDSSSNIHFIRLKLDSDLYECYVLMNPVCGTPQDMLIKPNYGKGLVVRMGRCMNLLPLSYVATDIFFIFSALVPKGINTQS